MRRYPVISVLVLLSVLIIPAIFANVLAPHDPITGNLPDRLKPPAWVEGGSAKYLLGTDTLGRDILSRMLFGARISLSVSLVALLIGGAIGTMLGLIAGYFGKWVDSVVMRLVDMMLSMPLILIALVLVIVFEPGVGTTIGVVALLLWARYARLIRAQVLTIKEQDFISRARVAGASDFRIIVRHVFPNVVNTLIVIATLQVGVVILLEATLSFLGAGIPRPQPSWGAIVSDGRNYIATAWWISVIPGLAIMLTVLSMNMLGDWLRDRLDPKLRQI
jgi:peptide/nickel transport system permease protein